MSQYCARFKRNSVEIIFLSDSGLEANWPQIKIFHHLMHFLSQLGLDPSNLLRGRLSFKVPKKDLYRNVENELKIENSKNRTLLTGQIFELSDDHGLKNWRAK